MTGPVERGSAAGGASPEAAPSGAERSDPARSSEVRPADAARRALRAARERREGAAGGSSEGRDLPQVEAVGESVPDNGERDERPRARPGDAARAALRRAGAETGTSGMSGTSGTTGAEADRSGTEARPVPHTPDPASDRRGARPADVAREALRAALGERRQARADEEEGGDKERTRRPRRPAPVDPGVRRGSADGAAALRAREVREFLAEAFRMPPMDESHADESHADESHTDEPYADEPYADESATPDPDTRHRSDPARRAPDSPSTPAPQSPTFPALTDSDSAQAGPPPAPSAQSVPATPRVPRSMAAPVRDGELRRTFPAFAPRPSDDVRFAETWWGDAWVAALEEGALDPKRLARGRGYAQEGHVDAITVTPGLVLAYVRGSRPRPYRVQVRLRTLGDRDWARFLDAAADRPGHIAALLDKEMPHSLAECGVPLLPGPGELDPQCSCPDRGHPCKHAAALCYQTARLLDADAFVLLLLRGRGERELLDALSRLSAARAARAAQEREPAPLPGVRATDVLAPDRQLPPLPAPLPAPPHPEQPPVYPAAPGGPDPFALDQLATDAAVRAHALLSTGRDPVAELTLWQDAVRLAAARPGSGLTAATRALYASLASAADRTPAELARAVAAWRQGGLEGLAVLEEPWDPPAGRFDRARPLLLAADLPAFRPWRNHLTHPRGHVQLRLGREGLWYPYESEPGHDDWWPRGTPDLDPVGALTGLGASPEG
ncbi:SWIM zinc finger family protein [Streptomyces sp. DT2A-34]|uniref:SWIM zinc finger family protein n=1 Tax=Streptomyces sp. DT2A-34 TaxID=3051182 RepID=UPI00265BDE07|nr:SWIM zinc finger family protein [Streptomyces sp. DT2A-34]MDO0910496.1 SWIM zinc finger family protein [Streptomyces sp. DT2A-34]